MLSWQPQPGNSKFICRGFLLLFVLFFRPFTTMIQDVTSQGLSNIWPCSKSPGQLISDTPCLEFGAGQLEPRHSKEVVSGTRVIRLCGECYEGKKTHGPWLSVCVLSKLQTQTFHMKTDLHFKKGPVPECRYFSIDRGHYTMPLLRPWPPTWSLLLQLQTANMMEVFFFF